MESDAWNIYFFKMPGMETWQRRDHLEDRNASFAAKPIYSLASEHFFYSLLSICRDFYITKWKDVDFTVRGDYFKVQHQKGMLIVHGIASQRLLHWGLQWSFLDCTLHYSGTESTYC